MFFRGVLGFFYFVFFLPFSFLGRFFFFVALFAFFLPISFFFWPFPFFGPFLGRFFWAPFWGPFVGFFFFRGLFFRILSVYWGPAGLSKARNPEALHDHWFLTTADTVSDQDKRGEAQLSHRLLPEKALRPDPREGLETRPTITHPITQNNSWGIFCVINVLAIAKNNSQIIFLCVYNHFGTHSMPLYVYHYILTSCRISLCKSVIPVHAEFLLKQLHVTMGASQL